MEEEIAAQSKCQVKDYESVIDKSVLDELRILAEKLSGKVIQMVNSTYIGGGVSEILEHMIPLLNQLGVDTRWDVIWGNEDFFEVTKKFHNALHGKREVITQDDFDLFSEVTRTNLEKMELYGDILFIHDPQPIGLIAKKEEIGRKWIWRCHIDVSKPDNKVWKFLRNYVVDYDVAVFSAPNFAQHLPLRQFMITPSIDPLSDKNRELEPAAIEKVLSQYGLNSDKPMILQVSRFDRLKDPVGVIEAYKMVKKSIDCQLVLAGGNATDDPESEAVYEEVEKSADGDKDIHVLLIPAESDLEINALQRAATVIIQKSLKEGFGLTISEALWKAKPVVASAVGGIPLQIKNKYTGLLCYSVEGAAYDLRKLLSNPEYAEQLGKNGREHVRQNFLITSHLRNYLILFLVLDDSSDVIHL